MITVRCDVAEKARLLQARLLLFSLPEVMVPERTIVSSLRQATVLKICVRNHMGKDHFCQASPLVPYRRGLFSRRV